MSVHLITLAIAPLLLVGSANAETKRDDTDKGEEVEARYRSYGAGKNEFSASVRYAPTAHLDVGWRVVAQHYGAQGAGLTGWHVTVGPIWAAVARLKSGAAGFRAELNPWMAVATTFVDTASSVKVSVPVDGRDVAG